MQQLPEPLVGRLVRNSWTCLCLQKARQVLSCLSCVQVIDRVPKVAGTSTAEPLQQLRGAIQLADVHFSYPARPDVPIFSGMNLSIAAGQTVALVGESGSGECCVMLRKQALSMLTVTISCRQPGLTVDQPPCRRQVQRGVAGDEVL